MRDNARWQLTDFQRFLVALMIATAGFLSAMAWGMRSLVMLLVAGGIVIIAGLGVFLLGLYYNSRPSGSGTATVVEAPPPPVGQIIARAELRVRLHLKGAGDGVVKLRDAAVPTAKWPRPGDVLPVEVDPHTRHVRIRWDKADAGQARASDHFDVVEDDIEYAPTPPSPTSPSPAPPSWAVQPAPMRAIEAGPNAVTALPLDDDPALGPGPNVTYSPDPNHRRAERSDLELSDLDLSALDLSDLNLSDLDLSDLDLGEVNLGEVEQIDQPGPTGQTTLSATPTQRTESPEPPASTESTGLAEPTESTGLAEPTESTGLAEPRESAPGEAGATELGEAKAKAAGYELPMRPIPQPRPAEIEFDAASAPKPSAARAQSMGVMLVVSDTKRSLEFYRDLLGLTVVDSTAGSVVLGFGTGRLLLRQVVDMSPVDRRVVHVHIEVTDVEASYQELRAKGVSFVHRPRVMSRGDKLELWAATFRDPDGHAIALTQWRDREDATH